MRNAQKKPGARGPDRVNNCIPNNIELYRAGILKAKAKKELQKGFFCLLVAFGNPSDDTI